MFFASQSLGTKCFAVAMSALFAATPMVPAQAMPIAVVTAQSAESSAAGKVETVQYRDNRRIIRRPGYRNRARAGNRQRIVNRRAVNRRAAQRQRIVRNRRAYRNRQYVRPRVTYNRGYNRGYRAGFYRGYRGYRYQRPGYRYHNGYWFPFAAFATGAIIGGAIAADRGVSYSSAHVRWCNNRYRSYRAYDNTFQPYHGPRRQCYSPYS